MILKLSKQVTFTFIEELMAVNHENIHKQADKMLALH